MGALLAPVRCRSQPQRPAKIARNTELGRALVVGVTGAQHQGVGLDKMLNLSSGVSRVPTEHGIAFQHSANNGTIDFGAPGGLDTLIAPGNSFTVHWRGYVDVLGVRQGLATDHNAAGGASSFLLEITDANTWRVEVNVAALGLREFSGAPVTTGLHDVLVYFIQGVGVFLIVDGVAAGSSLFTSSLAGGSALRLGGFGAYPSLGFMGRTVAFNLFAGDVSPHFQTLQDNPWQLYAERPLIIPDAPAAAADTSLAGGALCVAAASGVLSTQFRMAGAASLASAATGSLSTAVPLSGSAALQTSASGGLTTSIRLFGSAALQVSAAGSLAAAGAALTGAATLAASSSGLLTTQVRLFGTASLAAAASGVLVGGGALLAGDASVRVAAAGSLSTSIQLSGAAAVQASAAGQLDGGSAQLSGTAAARMTGAGALTTSISLSGAAALQASASGALAGAAVVLSGGASMRANGTGDLSTAIVLSGLAPARIAASGSITTWISLSGAARVTASAAGALGVGVRYARAPAGSGYTPQRDERQSRPVAIQRNIR